MDPKNKERNDIIMGLVAFFVLMGGIVAIWYSRRAPSSNGLTEVSPDRPGGLMLARPSPGPPPDVPGTIMSYRGRNGESFLFDVTGMQGHTIWGTGIYTDDSPVAVAAVHAGALRVGEQGIVRVTILPGQRSYEGTERNGVTSANYERWDGSYSLERVTGPTSQPVLSLPAPRAAETPVAPPPTTRRAVGEVYFVETIGDPEGTVWGSGIYTDDSSIPAAAVHAGLLAPGEHGTLRVTVREGLSSYKGSTQNGVTSKPYGKWEGSFTVERAHSPTTVPVL
jgi:hypothetical protein